MVLDFLPLFIAVGLFSCFASILFVLLPFARKKRSKKILDHFRGQFSFPLGTISFTYRNTLFYISRLARGGGMTGVGGSYSVLYTYLQSSDSFVIGNEYSNKYSNFFFRRLNSELFSLAGGKIYISSNDQLCIKKIKDILSSDLDFALKLSSLFEKDYAHFSLGKEFHVAGWGVVKRKSVFRYICLSEKIFEDPHILENQLDIIQDFLQRMSLS